MSSLFIQNAEPKEANEIAELFANTILSVNTADYSVEQTTLWASAKEPLLNWQNKITTQYFLVVKINDQIVGFSSLAEATGYVDVLYVHKDFQRRGVAKKAFASIGSACKIASNCVFTHRSEYHG